MKLFLRMSKFCAGFFILASFSYMLSTFFEKPPTVLMPEELPPVVVTQAKAISDFDEAPKRFVSASGEDRLRFLLLGTDEREDEPARSDTIILATYFPNEGQIKLLSIPRDTKVRIAGQEKMDKVNAAHAIGGMELIQETLENWSGLRIDHVAKVNFNGFKELIDGVGGVTVSPERPFSYGGNDFELGEQTIDGTEALNYVRFRKDQDGDFGRIKRQQEVVEKTLKAVLSDFSVTSLPSYLSFYKKHVKTDMSILEMAEVAKLAHKNGIDLESMTLKTSSAKIDRIWYELASEESVHEALQWLEDKPDMTEMTPEKSHLSTLPGNEQTKKDLH